MSSLFFYEVRCYYDPKTLLGWMNLPFKKSGKYEHHYKQKKELAKFYQEEKVSADEFKYGVLELVNMRNDSNDYLAVISDHKNIEYFMKFDCFIPNTLTTEFKNYMKTTEEIFKAWSYKVYNHKYLHYLNTEQIMQDINFIQSEEFPKLSICFTKSIADGAAHELANALYQLGIPFKKVLNEIWINNRLFFIFRFYKNCDERYFAGNYFCSIRNLELVVNQVYDLASNSIRRKDEKFKTSENN